MQEIADLAAWSVWAVAALFFLPLFVAFEGGYRVAQRLRRRSDRPAEGVGVVVGAMLTLFAFVLALVLSIAMARFLERRAATLTEAAAIGTAWLRTETLDHPRAGEIAVLLERHARLRLEFVRAPAVPAVLDEISARAGALQAEIWAHMVVLARERPDPIVTALMSALNETFDAADAMTFAQQFPLPPMLNRMLLLMALLCALGLGAQLGVRGHRLHGMMLLLAALWTSVLIYVFDLAAARVGWIRTQTTAYEWTISSMQRDQAPRSALPPPSPPAAPR